MADVQSAVHARTSSFGLTIASSALCALQADGKGIKRIPAGRRQKPNRRTRERRERDCVQGKARSLLAGGQLVRRKQKTAADLLRLRRRQMKKAQRRAVNTDNKTEARRARRGAKPPPSPRCDAATASPTTTTAPALRTRGGRDKSKTTLLWMRRPASAPPSRQAATIKLPSRHEATAKRERCLSPDGPQHRKPLLDWSRVGFAGATTSLNVRGIQVSSSSFCSPYTGPVDEASAADAMYESRAKAKAAEEEGRRKERREKMTASDRLRMLWTLTKKQRGGVRGGRTPPAARPQSAGTRGTIRRRVIMSPEDALAKTSPLRRALETAGTETRLDAAANVAAVEEKFRNKRAIAAPPLSRPLSHALVVVAPSLGQVSYRDLFWTRAARHGERSKKGYTGATSPRSLLFEHCEAKGVAPEPLGLAAREGGAAKSTTINLAHTSVGDDRIAAASFRDVTKLDLRSSRLSFSGVKKILESDSAPSLKLLDLSGNLRLRNVLDRRRCSRYIGRLLAQHPRWTLALEDLRLDDADAVALGRGVCSLEAVSPGNSEKRNQGASLTLSLNNNLMGSLKGCQALSGLLSQGVLQELHLSNNNITAGAMVILASAVQSARGCRVLDVSYNRAFFGQDGKKALAAFCTMLEDSALVHLSMSFMGISVRGMQEVKTALENARPNLHGIHVDGNAGWLSPTGHIFSCDTQDAARSGGPHNSVFRTMASAKHGIAPESCVICGGYRCINFKYVHDPLRGGITRRNSFHWSKKHSASAAAVQVRLHVSALAFQPLIMNIDRSDSTAVRHSLTLLLPPGPIEYFYSKDGRPCLSTSDAGDAIITVDRLAIQRLKEEWNENTPEKIERESDPLQRAINLTAAYVSTSHFPKTILLQLKYFWLSAFVSLARDQVLHMHSMCVEPCNPNNVTVAARVLRPEKAYLYDTNFLGQGVAVDKAEQTEQEVEEEEVVAKRAEALEFLNIAAQHARSKVPWDASTGECGQLWSPVEEHQARIGAAAKQCWQHVRLNYSDTLTRGRHDESERVHTMLVDSFERLHSIYLTLVAAGTNMRENVFHVCRATRLKGSFSIYGIIGAKR